MRKRKEVPHLTAGQVSIKQAWMNLASDVLLLAIDDVRQTKDGDKSYRAKKWLLSPAAKLFFDSFLDRDLDIRDWVLADCPILDKP